MKPFPGVARALAVAGGFVLLTALPPCHAAFQHRSRHPASVRYCAPATPAFRLGAATSSDEALQRTASQLQKMQQAQAADSEEEQLYQNYARQSANTLKQELEARRLPTKGRKPDLARRLVEHDLRRAASEGGEVPTAPAEWDSGDDSGVGMVREFAGLSLSPAAGKALGRAQFRTPSPIQQAVIPRQANGESLILHAETGSGKTLAYLLPITELLWLEHQEGIVSGEDGAGYGLIMTPTRELAAQVAGVASVLAPPGTVRLVSHPTNLMNDGLKDRGEGDFGGRLDKGDGRTKPRLFVGSAKAIMHSLYGDGKMPASPTTKPEAMELLQSTRWVVMDEVDRLLNVKKNRGGGDGGSRKRHEKPAAIVASAVARLTFGRAQTIAASATVGRVLKRELSRVLGLPPQEAPPVVRVNDDLKDDDEDRQPTGGHVQRAVTIPETVEHYMVPVDTTSVGKLMTNAIFVLGNLQRAAGNRPQRVLLVLTRGCGINTKTAVGALQHFRVKPEPLSLLDVLEADGTDRMIQIHREVTGATGVGESYFSSKEGAEEEEEEDGPRGEDEGYLLVTGEDTVRGLHLDGLDVVLVVGRAAGPDEYTHIAGRTGRAGRSGKVVNVLSDRHADAMAGWEKMLSIDIQRLTAEEVQTLQ